MNKMTHNIKETYLHLSFEIGIILKGINAAAELIGGSLLLIISNASIYSLASGLAQHELSQDPKDFFANYTLHSISNFSISTQHFIALYLIIHGAVKLLLVINLLRKKLWAYPVSIVAFILFIVYQLSRFSVTHSLWLIGLTLFDLILIVLTWHEYKRRKAML